MAPISGSQGLFSFLCALGVPGLCLTSLVFLLPSSVAPKMALGFPILARSRGTLSSCSALATFFASPLTALSLRSQPPVVSQNIGDVS